jgi:DNA repair ATPase RecN
MVPKNFRIADRHGFVRVFEISTCIFALLQFTGCATRNYTKADAACDSLRQASIQINAENRCIDVTLAALDNLVNKPANDLEPQFETYSAWLDRLADSARRADKADEVAREKSREYFQSWDKETAAINFEAVRDQSVSRKTQVSTEFNTVNQRYRENQAVIKPLISYLQDIRTALSTDLTMGGLQSVKPLVENAEQNARKVQTALARLTSDLAASRTQMSSVLPRETEARGGVSDPAESTQQHAQSTP